LSQLDEDLLRLLNQAGGSPFADAAFVAFTVMGMLAVSLMAAPLLYAKGKRDSAFDLAVSVIIASVLVELIKIVTARDRPFESLDDSVRTISFYGLAESTGSSFPSGHAARMFVVATVISLNVRIPGRVTAFLVAAMVAVSRVYLGLHWPTDIVAGAVLGVAVALVFALLVTRWRPYNEVRRRVVLSIDRMFLRQQTADKPS